MRRPVFLFLLFFSLCLASTLYMFGGSAAARDYTNELSSETRSSYKSPYQQHLDEAIERMPALEKHIQDFEAKQIENTELLKATRSYLAHIDSYFEQVKVEAEAIRDSSLRTQVLASIAAREANAAAKTASLRTALADYEILNPLAADYKKAAEIMGSLSAFETYLQDNKVDTTDVRKATLNTYNLIEAGKALVRDTVVVF
jgi:hypothetical protein